MKIPTSTYRLQFNNKFRFKDAKKLAKFLNHLGFGSIYASPIFDSRPKSAHGYDIVNPNKISQELGGLAGFNELLREAKKRNLQWLQDIVPNHMSYNIHNYLLKDILESGNRSKYYDFFDIDWSHKTYDGKVMAPFLGEDYEKCLDNGEIRIVYDNGFNVEYYDFALPLKIESYIEIIKSAAQLDKNQKKLWEQKLIKLQKLKNNGLKIELNKLCKKNPKILNSIQKVLEHYNHESKILHKILDKQNFKLLNWKESFNEINYRRFFDINELICTKNENKNVFNELHELILSFAKKGIFTGLRVDHIDGLYNPNSYLNNLRAELPGTYIVVEKILSGKEQLRKWPVHGTTGYEFLDYANKLFVFMPNEKKISKIYGDFTGSKKNYNDILYECKSLVVKASFNGEIKNLATLFIKIFGNYFRFSKLVEMISELTASLDVYRTYIAEHGLKSIDIKYLNAALNKAKKRRPGLKPGLLFIESLIAKKPNKESIKFFKRMQQFTGSIMAKGFEDTMFYNYNRLLSLNEVGSDPKNFGISTKDFHDFNIMRANEWPHCMNTTSTHDTKRGEDVRARLNALSEIPEEWETKLKTWSKANSKFKSRVNTALAPSRNEEYYIYQTLLGSFSLSPNAKPYIKRMKAHIVKALREAKKTSSWKRPETQYEHAVMRFIENVMLSKDFLHDFFPFQKKLSYYGFLNSISQTLLKITSPGIPDFYQGTELLDLNLVDPDNRNPVNYDKRMQILKKFSKNGIIPKNLLLNYTSGDAKMFLIWKALNGRIKNKILFENGKYLPLSVKGKYNGNIIAFARVYKNRFSITVVPRFLISLVKENQLPLGKIWEDTYIKIPDDFPKKWKDVISNKELEFSADNGMLKIAILFESFPASMLVNKG